MTRALEFSERFELAEWLAARMVRAFGVAPPQSRPSATAPRDAAKCLGAREKGPGSARQKGPTSELGSPEVPSPIPLT